MRVRFVYETSKESTLKIIPEIPNFPLCHLEGRNGIGKTLAIRLLQLVSGEQPFRSMPLAWVSLKDQLRSCNITCDQFPEGSARLEFELTPSQWPDAPDDLTDDDLGRALIDGNAASFSEVRSRVAIIRVAGDETLPETFAQGIDEREGALARLNETIEERVADWETRLEALGSVARGVSGKALRDAVAAVADASEIATGEVAYLRQLEARRISLERLAVLEDEIAQREVRIPELEAALTHAGDEIRRREFDLATVEKRLTQLLAERSQSKGSRQEVQRLNSLVKRRQNALSKAELERSSKLSLLQLTAVPKDHQFEDLLDAARSQLETALTRRRELDTIGPALTLTAAVEAPLVEAVTSGQGHHVVADLDRPIRADELLEGVETRRRDLAEQPRPGELEGLDAAVERYRARLRLLETLPTTESQYERARARVQEAIGELRTVVGRTGAAAESALQTAQHAVSVARERLVEQRTIEAGLQRELADFQVTSLSDLEQERDTTADELQLTESVSESLAELSHQLDNARSRLAERELARELASARLDGLRRSASILSNELVSAPEYRWAVPAWEAAQAAASSREFGVADIQESELRNAEAISLFVEGCIALSELLLRARDTALASQSLLHNIADDVRSTTSGAGVARVRTELADQAHPGLREKLKRYLERDFATNFATPELRSELFDQTEDVALDLDKLTLQWKTADGELRRRPLEAFSSGEQAFTYTLAKLESLVAAQPVSTYVFLALDEFGAFVARDRLDQLLASLRQRALGRIADQIVVILPLSRNYLEDPEPEDGDDSVEATCLRQVRSRGYFAIAHAAAVMA